MRMKISQFRALENKEEAEKELPQMYKVIDRVLKRGIIHRNKAANLKSKLSKHAAKLA